LTLCAGYAACAGALPAAIRFGEGLVGQCAIEQPVDGDPSAGYLQVSSTLAGGARPPF
jgi:hypothetical protein